MGPDAQILANYLVQKGPEYFQAKSIVELGSGTGLVGLVVGAFQNADVWITDQASVLDFSLIYPVQLILSSAGLNIIDLCSKS